MSTKVFHRDNAKVHVLGHVYQGELLAFYNLVQSKNITPVRDELRHPVRNGQLTVSIGVPAGRVVLADGGATIDLKDRQAWVSGQIPYELVFTSDESIGETSEGELEICRTLSSEGFISVHAMVEHDSGMVFFGLAIKTIGVAEDDTVLDEILSDVEDALKDVATPDGKGLYVLQQAMKRILGCWVARRLRRHPMTVPTVVEQ